MKNDCKVNTILAKTKTIEMGFNPRHAFIFRTCNGIMYEGLYLYFGDKIDTNSMFMINLECVWRKGD